MRKTMSISVILTAAVLGLALASSCAKVDWNDPAGVLDASIKALGGQERLTGWKTRVEKGTIISIRPGWGTLKGNCTNYVEKPDKLVWDQDFSAYDNPFYFVYYYNGGESWYELNMGIRQSQAVTDLLARRLKEIDDIAYFRANSDSIYLVQEVPGDSLFSAADFTRVGCSGKDIDVTYDIRKTDLMPVRKIETTRSGENTTVNTTVMSDYRKLADGRMAPFHLVVYRNGTKTTEFIWDSIDYGVSIDPAIFEKGRPSAQ